MESDQHAFFQHRIDTLFVDGFAPAEDPPLRDHLAECSACQQYLDTGTRLLSSLSDLHFDLDPDLPRRIHSALETRAQQQQARVPRVQRIVPVSLAAVLLTLIGSSLELTLSHLAASLFHLQRSSLQHDVMNFWILPSSAWCCSFRCYSCSQPEPWALVKGAPYDRPSFRKSCSEIVQVVGPHRWNLPMSHRPGHRCGDRRDRSRDAHHAALRQRRPGRGNPPRPLDPQPGLRLRGRSPTPYASSPLGLRRRPDSSPAWLSSVLCSSRAHHLRLRSLWSTDLARPTLLLVLRSSPARRGNPLASEGLAPEKAPAAASDHNV